MDHKRILVKVWSEDSEDGDPTEYIRADIVEALEEALREAMAEAAQHVHGKAVNGKRIFDILYEALSPSGNGEGT